MFADTRHKQKVITHLRVGSQQTTVMVTLASNLAVFHNLIPTITEAIKH